MENFYLWLVIGILCLIMEIGTPGLFYFLSFSFGAGITAIASLNIHSMMLLSLIFLISSTLSILILQLFIRSWKHRHKQELTNVYALQGKQGFVIIDITPEQPGQVKIQGTVWSAKSRNNNESIRVGTPIEVVSVTGAFLVVRSVS